MKNIAIIGAGSMGLAAAYYLAKHGHKVTVYEVDKIPGGMAAHFDFAGISIERFYHFICKSDKPLFELLKELGIENTLKWRTTRMGYYYKDKLYNWGDPISLLKFPYLDLVSKIRYGLHAFISTKRSDWQSLDGLKADIWIRKWIGEKAYNILWKKLFELKFFEYSNNISAAWIWTRIKRIGTSRKNIMQEELGYIDGGSETLIDSLVKEIKKYGGEIKLNSPITCIVIDKEKVKGVKVNDVLIKHDEVISTIPIPYITKIIPNLPIKLKKKYNELDNIGVVCVLYQLKKSLIPYFWLNINDDHIDIPGIIEFTNLRSIKDKHIIYIPYYMPQTHPKFNKSDKEFLAETFDFLQKINSNIKKEDVIATKIGRLRYAQPVCPPKFLEKLPPIQTGIKGLQIADTSYYYPEDRGISESVKLAKIMAESINVE